jgi:hypothetical protein
MGASLDVLTAVAPRAARFVRSSPTRCAPRKSSRRTRSRAVHALRAPL